MIDKQMIRHALYDIHEYADLIRGKTNCCADPIGSCDGPSHNEGKYFNKLVTLILDRVKQINLVVNNDE